MSEAERESKLLLRAEALVSVATLKEPNWDTFAARIERALSEGGPTDDSLLLPPLPESVEDGVLGVVPKAPRAVEAPTSAAPVVAAAVTPIEDRETERPDGTLARAKAAADGAEEAAGSQREGGLAELARAAVARRGAKDAVSLAKESFAIAAQGRGAAEPIAEPTIKVAPVILKERAERTVPPVRRSRPFDTRGPWIGVGVAAIGLAAGFALYLSGQRTTQIVQLPAAEVAMAPAPPAPVAAATEAPRPVAPPVTPDMLPSEQARTAPEPVAVSPDALGAVGASTKTGAGATAERAPSTPASGGAAKPEKVVLEEEQPTKEPVSPTKPASPAGMRPAEFNANGGVSDRPSTGAAQAAVGAVLGAARSCIAGQPQGSSATIQFGSSGEVTGVSVGGPAQGTPAAACIQAALGKARVQPFAAPSFSLAVTVRPP
jgi:hypothetical protein